MSDPSSRLASAATKATRLNRTIDHVCTRLENLDRTARNCGKQLSDSQTDNDFEMLPVELKAIALDVVKLKQDSEARRVQLEAAENRLERVKDNNQKLQTENKKLQAEIRVLKRDLDDDLQDQLRDAKREIAKLKREKQDLLDRLYDNGGDRSKVKKLEAEVEKLKEDNLSLKVEDKALKKDNAKLRLESQALERAKTELQKIVDIFGPKKLKKPNCRGCENRRRHLCDENFDGKIVNF